VFSAADSRGPTLSVSGAPPRPSSYWSGSSGSRSHGRRLGLLRSPTVGACRWRTSPGIQPRALRGCPSTSRACRKPLDLTGSRPREADPSRHGSRPRRLAGNPHAGADGRRRTRFKATHIAPSAGSSEAQHLGRVGREARLSFGRHQHRHRVRPPGPPWAVLPQDAVTVITLISGMKAVGRLGGEGR
jgi:hypothetical protein